MKILGCLGPVTADKTIKSAYVGDLEIGEG